MIYIIKMADKSYITTLLACAAVFLSVGCAPKKDPLPVGEKVISSPHQELTNASLYFYQGNAKRWWLDTDYMSRPLTDTGNITVAPVRITVYDSLGKPSTNILSDSGSSDSKMAIFDLWGRVNIKNSEGMVVTGERLRWYKDERRITSDTFVQVETKKGDILRGKGLEAMDNFSRFSFNSDVQGVFPDFKRRMEEGDDNFLR